MIFAGGLFDNWDWNVHPVYFGYGAVLAAALWLVWRLLLSVERLSGRPEKSDRNSAIPAQDRSSDPEPPMSANADTQDRPADPDSDGP